MTMMQEMKYGNLSVKYNDEDWDAKKSSKKSKLEALLAAGSAGVGVALFVGIVILGTHVSERFTNVFIFTGVLTMFMSMILLLAFMENKLYENTIKQFRFLDWISTVTNVDAKYNSGIINLKLEFNDGCMERRLTDVLRAMKCGYTTNMEKSKDIEDGSNVSIEIDITDPSSAQVEVLKVG